MAQNKKCFVPDCTTGYGFSKERYTMFSAPKDKRLQVLWKKAISRGDRQLSEKDVVCAKHFLETDIIKEWTNIHNVKIPYKRHRLVHTAVPSIFSYKLPSNENEQQKPMQKKSSPDKVNPATSDILNTEEITPALNNNIFQQLWLNYGPNGALKMPNTEWTVHYVDKNEYKKILITECTVSKVGAPSFLRNIIINQDVQLKYYLGSIEIAEETIRRLGLESSTQHKNIDEIQSCLDKFSNNTIICDGGPLAKVHSLYEVSISAAKIDVNGFWRHNSCPLLLNGTDRRCMWCKEVYDYCINHLFS